MAGQSDVVVEYTQDDFVHTTKPYDFIASIENAAERDVITKQYKSVARAYGITASTFNKLMSDAYKKLSQATGSDDIAKTNFTGQEQSLLCPGYYCNDNGVYKDSMYGPICVIPHPILPTKRIVNLETKELKLEISFKRGDDEWNKVVVPRETLASSQRIISLANRNIAVNSENARDVVKYIADIENRNYNALEKGVSVSRMGWLPDGRFMPYVDDVSFDGEGAEYRKIYEGLTKPAGSEDEWMKVAREVRGGQSIACRIALAAGFAAPLVEKLEANSFVVHFWGSKGCAKTVASMLATSIWGNPKLGAGIFKTFNGTKISVELQAAFCRNLPVVLDDLKLVDNNQKNFDDIIYMICAGLNRGRATKNAELRLQSEWCTCAITNSEAPILQIDSAGGAEVRTLEINFKHTPFFGTDDRAREVASILKHNYGFAGRKLIQAIQDMPEQELNSIFNRHKRRLPNEKQVDSKQTLSAAIILTADEIANRVIFHDNLSLTANDMCEFLTSKTEADENVRCFQYVQDWVSMNIKRFDPSDENKGAFWGIIEDNTAYINPQALADALKGHYALKPFLDWARERGLLTCDDDKKRMTTRKTLRPGDKSKRCYALCLDDYPSDASNTSQFITLKEDQVPDDLPF